MDRTPRDVLVIDFEATCWADGDTTAPQTPPGWRYRNEIIEIGAVLLDGHTLAIKDEFQSFVKPRYYPVLSEFCRQLTHIGQAEVDNAPCLHRVLWAFADHFHLRADDHDPVFASWGAYDKKQLDDDCQKCNIPNPFAPHNHLNLKMAVSRALGLKRAGLQRTLDKLDLQFEGTHHRGIDDARNIARIVQVSAERVGGLDWLQESNDSALRR